jgi:hypothetical protein
MPYVLAMTWKGAGDGKPNMLSLFNAVLAYFGKGKLRPRGLFFSSVYAKLGRDSATKLRQAVHVQAGALSITGRSDLAAPVVTPDAR